MKYASERGGMSTSVHDWKPCPPEQFAKLLHRYATTCGNEHGHEGVNVTAMKLDRVATATIYYMPKKGKVEESNGISSPVLMTVSMADGRVICFESLQHGLEEAPIRDMLGANTPGLIDGKWKLRVPNDGIESIETGLNFRTRPRGERETIERRIENLKGYGYTIETDNNGTHHWWRREDSPSSIAVGAAENTVEGAVQSAEEEIAGQPGLGRLKVGPGRPLTWAERIEALRKQGYGFQKETAGWYWIWGDTSGSERKVGKFRYSSQEEAVDDAEKDLRFRDPRPLDTASRSA